MKTLHLIDAASPQACPTTLAALASVVQAEQRTQDSRVLLLGGTALGKAAADVGLHGPTVKRLGVPYGRALLGLPAVIRRMRDLGRMHRIHAWSAGTLHVARLLRARTPRVLHLTQPPDAAMQRVLGRIRHRPGWAPTRVITASCSLLDQALSLGLPPSMVHMAEADLEPGWIRHDQRQALRTAWGVRHPQAWVIALLSDPPESADTPTAAMVLGLARESLRPVHFHVPSEAAPSEAVPLPELALLVHPRQSRRLRAQRTVDQLASPFRLIQDARLATPWEVLPGCDAVLSFGPTAGGLSLRWALAADRPVVAEASPAVREAVEHHEASALLADAGTPKALAHQLHQLIAAGVRA